MSNATVPQIEIFQTAKNAYGILFEKSVPLIKILALPFLIFIIADLLPGTEGQKLFWKNVAKCAMASAFLLRIARLLILDETSPWNLFRSRKRVGFNSMEENIEIRLMWTILFCFLGIYAFDQLSYWLFISATGLDITKIDFSAGQNLSQSMLIKLMVFYGLNYSIMAFIVCRIVLFPMFIILRKTFNFKEAFVKSWECTKGNVLSIIAVKAEVAIPLYFIHELLKLQLPGESWGEKFLSSCIEGASMVLFSITLSLIYKQLADDRQ